MESATTDPRTAHLLVALALALAGCATTAPVAGPDYEPGPSYHAVMAEIAAQRGEYATAAAEYLNVAERSDDPEASRRAAAFAFEYGFDAIALRAARRWARLAPQEASAHLYLARLLVRRNDVAGAAAESASALGPVADRAAEDYQLLAAELAQEDNAAAVTRVLTRLAAGSPPAAALDLAVARAAWRSGDLDLALESAHAALAADTAGDVAADASVLIGRILLAQGKGEAALDHMARLIEAEPSLEMGLEHARMLAALERHTEALQDLDELAGRFGPEPELRRLRALVNLDANEPRAAWEGFGELLRDGEFVDESLYYIGEIAEREARADQAAEVYERVPEGPYLVPAQAALARIAEAREGPDAALARLDQFVAANPRLTTEGRRLRAGVLQRAGRLPEARAELDAVLLDRPADAGVLLARGALLEQIGELAPALADMRAAALILPDDAAALNALGYTLANRTGRHAEAYRLIRRAMELDPGNAAIIDSYGWVLYRKGWLPEARSYLQLAWSQFQDPEVAAHLGEVLWRQGEREQALSLWAEALERNPDSAPLKETMARFRD